MYKIRSCVHSYRVCVFHICSAININSAVTDIIAQQCFGQPDGLCACQPLFLCNAEAMYLESLLFVLSWARSLLIIFFLSLLKVCLISFASLQDCFYMLYLHLQTI